MASIIGNAKTDYQMSTNLPILYTFRRCPYAMRARLAIAYSQQRIEWREVLLKAKPDELIQISPKATVPVLHLENGQVIDESLDIMFWALNKNDPDLWIGNDPNARNQINTLIQENDFLFKPNLDRYKYSVRFPEKTPTEHRKVGEQFLAGLEQRLTLTPYLIGEQITLADTAIFPFIRQFVGVDPKWFQDAPYPKLRAWLQQWLDSALFQTVMKKHAPWNNGDIPIVFPPSH